VVIAVIVAGGMFVSRANWHPSFHQIQERSASSAGVASFVALP
jgi:hypothetical protein